MDNNPKDTHSGDATDTDDLPAADTDGSSRMITEPTLDFQENDGVLGDQDSVEYCSVPRCVQDSANNRKERSRNDSSSSHSDVLLTSVSREESDPDDNFGVRSTGTNLTKSSSMDSLDSYNPQSPFNIDIGVIFSRYDSPILSCDDSLDMVIERTASMELLTESSVSPNSPLPSRHPSYSSSPSSATSPSATPLEAALRILSTSQESIVTTDQTIHDSSSSFRGHGKHSHSSTPVDFMSIDTPTGSVDEALLNQPPEAKMASLTETVIKGVDVVKETEGHLRGEIEDGVNISNTIVTTPSTAQPDSGMYKQAVMKELQCKIKLRQEMGENHRTRNLSESDASSSSTSDQTNSEFERKERNKKHAKESRERKKKERLELQQTYESLEQLHRKLQDANSSLKYNLEKVQRWLSSHFEFECNHNETESQLPSTAPIKKHQNKGFYAGHNVHENKFGVCSMHGSPEIGLRGSSRMSLFDENRKKTKDVDDKHTVRPSHDMSPLYFIDQMEQSNEDEDKDYRSPWAVESCHRTSKSVKTHTNASLISRLRRSISEHTNASPDAQLSVAHSTHTSKLNTQERLKTTVGNIVPQSPQRHPVLNTLEPHNSNVPERITITPPKISPLSLPPLPKMPKLPIDDPITITLQSSAPTSCKTQTSRIMTDHVHLIKCPDPFVSCSTRLQRPLRIKIPSYETPIIHQAMLSPDNSEQSAFQRVGGKHGYNCIQESPSLTPRHQDILSILNPRSASP